MTLCELTNELTLQGNILVKVFDTEGNEQESRFVRDSGGLECIGDDLTDFEDCEVSYMYATSKNWLVIEVVLEEKEA